jgi:hypothetical protein
MRGVIKSIDMTRVLAFLTFLIVSVSVLGLTWERFRPLEVYYNVQQPYEVRDGDKPFVGGDPVYVRQVYCKHGNYPTTITIMLEDGFHEVLRTLKSSIKEGCYDSWSRSAQLPALIPSGTYRIRYHIEVEVSPFRTETYELVSEYFEVL